MTSCRISLAFILLSIYAPGRADEAPVDFEKHIAPIFEQHCVRCHSPGNNKGDVSLATFDDLKSNEYVIAGDPAQVGFHIVGESTVSEGLHH